ncbi:MAG: hypothetical protein ACYTEQ_22535 [Planctomycetota bacterium]|jgi:hypothetical protein
MSKKSNDDRYKDRLARITNKDIANAVKPHTTKKDVEHHHKDIESVRLHLGIRKDDTSMDSRIKGVLTC